MMKFSIGLGCAVLILAGCASNSGKQLAQAAKPAPDWTQPTSTGGTLTLSSLRGKPVYLNFFATWCPPCKDEAPYINSLQKQYASRGLQVVGIDELENAKLAESFRRQFHLVYPAVVDSGTLQAQYLINGLPVHVFIGRDGVIRKIVAGEMPRNEILRNVLSIL
ncbi:MAG TPA: TlpA disulfide reductase family protein [Candidatus Rubrimentiphilum sp.]|nr:TlpA disulfide reductase family protein [Candidatus Rubrimentiphilum sp.]